MIKICIILLIIHWSQQYDINFNDKSNTYAQVANDLKGSWKLHIQNKYNPDTDQIVDLWQSGDSLNNAHNYEYYSSKATIKKENIHIDKDGIPYFNGKYSYQGDDGIGSIINYIANKNGYQPKVLFGKNIYAGYAGPQPVHAPPTKDVGGNDCLLGSLLGGGCI